MIPDFTNEGVLPPGIHWTTWSEVVGRFGYNQHRKDLLSGMLIGLTALKSVGCINAFIDGSFVTDKVAPNDFDICYDETGIDWNLLLLSEPEILEFGYGRAIQKAKYQGEFFPTCFTETSTNTNFFDFFQINKQTGGVKGIIGLKL